MPRLHLRAEGPEGRGPSGHQQVLTLRVYGLQTSGDARPHREEIKVLPEAVTWSPTYH